MGKMITFLQCRLAVSRHVGVALLEAETLCTVPGQNVGPWLCVFRGFPFSCTGPASCPDRASVISEELQAEGIVYVYVGWSALMTPPPPQKATLDSLCTLSWFLSYRRLLLLYRYLSLWELLISLFLRWILDIGISSTVPQPRRSLDAQNFERGNSVVSFFFFQKEHS